MKTEIIITIIASVAGIVSTLITIIGYVRVRIEELNLKAKEKQNTVRKKLVAQVVGYYYEEQILIEELAKYTNRNPKTIKIEMRKNAAQHIDNKENYQPDMSANEARKYIDNN